MKSSILHRQVITPDDIERSSGCRKEHLKGELSLQQMFFCAGAAVSRYRTRSGPSPVWSENARARRDGCSRRKRARDLGRRRSERPCHSHPPRARTNW